MRNHKQFQGLICRITRLAARPATLALILMLVSIGLITAKPAQAQSYRVIHDFAGGQDGASPFTGLTIDAGGKIYGTAFSGGTHGGGTVFSMNSTGAGGWILSPLYSFAGGSDGAGPVTRLAIGPDGALYGATSAGGGANCIDYNGNQGCGTVYQLRPPLRSPASAIAYWSPNVLFRFSGSDGAYPEGDLTFDQAGNIYGIAINGGGPGWGLVYELTRSGGGWTEDVLYQAQNDGDGQYPWGGVTFDSAGNLYGVFSQNGPAGYGAIYKLAPSGGSWSESTVHGFTYHGNDGANPQGGLIRDSAGNLYGTTVHDPTGGGTIFELTPSGGNLSFNVLYGLTGGIDLGPYDKLVMDASGNLYGTTFGDGHYGYGSVFKLTHSGGSWSYTSLHDFTGGSDGANPMCSLVFDASGNLYGTASGGGAHNAGVVFQITP